MNRNPIFVTTGRAAGHSYPAHELLEGYAVTLYDLDVSRERQLRAATSSTEQANRARNAGRLQILEEKERDLREKAEALILKCQTPDEREMLRMRYLMLMDWATIARVADRRPLSSAASVMIQIFPPCFVVYAPMIRAPVLSASALSCTSSGQRSPQSPVWYLRMLSSSSDAKPALS